MDKQKDIDHEVTRCALTAAVMKVERETQETLAVIDYERWECGKARTPKQAALARLANGLQGYAVSLKTLRDQLQSADLSSGASRRELLYPVFIEASACIDTAQAWRKDTADTIKEQVRRLDDAASFVPVDSGAIAGTGQQKRGRKRNPETEEKRRRGREEKHKREDEILVKWESHVPKYQDENFTKKLPPLATFAEQNNMTEKTLKTMLDNARKRAKRIQDAKRGILANKR